jgi:hypothetical protein
MITLQNKQQLMTKHYNFHDILRVAIHTDSHEAIREFQAEYGAYEAPAGPADLEVTIAPFEVRPRAGARHLGRYRIDGEWIDGAEHYKVARWHFALRGLAAPATELYFHGGVFALFFLQHFFIEQIMRFRMLQKDVAFVHSGCVAEQCRSVLFPGPGQVGKTALALQQAVLGRQFQSEDYTFLSANGQTYSYLRRLHLSDHVHDACPEATQGLNTRHRLAIKTKLLIYYMTLKYADLSESVALPDVVPHARTIDRAQLGTVLLLTSADGTQLAGPRPAARDDVLQRVAAVNCLEGKPFYNIYLAAQYNGEVPPLAEWWARERDILQRAFADAACYELIVPRQAPRRATVLEGMRHAMIQAFKELGNEPAISAERPNLQPITR